MRPILLSLILFMVSSLSMAADVPSNAATPAQGYSAEQVRAELTELYQNLQAASYDLYVHTPKAEYDDAYQAVLGSISAPMTQLEVHKLLMRFVALADIAHTRIDFPIAEFMTFIQAEGKFLPLDLKVTESGIEIADYYGQREDIRAGLKLVAVNGMRAEDWLTQLQQYLAADHDYFLDVLIEGMIAPLAWLHDGVREHYLLTLEDSASKIRFTVRQPTLSYAQQSSGEAPQAVELPRDYRIEAGAIGYLKPGPFSNIYAEDSSQTWDTEEFFGLIDEAFSAFKAAQIEKLVIDLRNNPGGTNSFSDYMLGYFVDRPFRFAADFRVKVSSFAKAANQARLAADEPADSINAQLAAIYASHDEGEIVSFPLQDSQPLPLAQRLAIDPAKVFVIVDRYSYSNAVSVAAIVQDYGFGMIIGEPTADLATTYASMESFTLSRTGIEVGFPKAHIIRPNGDEEAAGVTPDHVLGCFAETSNAAQRLACALEFVAKQP